MIPECGSFNKPRIEEYIQRINLNESYVDMMPQLDGQDMIPRNVWEERKRKNELLLRKVFELSKGERMLTFALIILWVYILSCGNTSIVRPPTTHSFIFDL